MSLSFIGPGGSCERRWIVYALLRDNVQHHLEDGTPTAAFATLHALGDALAKGEISVPIGALRAELDRVAPLLKRPVADLAVSSRTRAVCALELPLTSDRGTELASGVGWEPPISLASVATLGDAFGSLVDELLRITADAAEDARLTVLDT
jgi:hypothetical protein